MSADGTWSEFFLHQKGRRAGLGDECSLRKPPKDIGVRAEWVRICGGCYRRLGRSAEPELEAAVRGEKEQATPHVSRKRQAAGVAREENANAVAPQHEPKETETYMGIRPMGLQKCMETAACPPSYLSGWRC